MNDKFLIVKNMKIFIMSLEGIVVNYPKKEYYVKNKLFSDACSILEFVYIANYTRDNNRKREIQIMILSKISMLDFYLERSYKLRYISEKECCHKCNQLLKITKMIYGWINYESKC